MSNENPNQEITTVLAQVASDVAGELEMAKLLPKILKTAMDTLHSEICTIYLREGNKLKCVAVEGFAPEMKGKEYELGEGLTGRIGKTGEPYNIKTPEELRQHGINGGKYDSIQWPSESGRTFRNLLALPLKIGSAILGVIKVENKKENYGETYFTNDDQRIFTIIATMIALVIVNAETHEKVEKQSKAISQALVAITNSVVGSFEQSELLNKIVKTTMETLKAAECSIFLRRPDVPETIICVITSRTKPHQDVLEYQKGEGLTGYVFATGKEYNIKNKEERDRLQREGIWKGKYDDAFGQKRGGADDFHSLLVVPLRIKNDIVGVIKAEHKRDVPCFSDEDLVLFKTIANVIALTIENAKLYQQLENQLKAASSKAAHRINNQVTSYDYVFAVLREEASKWFPNRTTLRELAERIRETNRNLKKMTEDFKRFGKPLNLDKKNHEINEMLRKEVETARRDELHIEVLMDAKIPPVKIDEGLLAESVRELFRNAKQAGAKQIWVSSELIEKGTHKFAKIVIEDNGPGIQKGFPIFTPFHSSHAKGTGLGLATVKESVEAHDGKVTLVSEGKRGGCFEIELPIEE